MMIAAALGATAVALLDACRESAAERPARIVGGRDGVVVVNGRRPTRIAVRVLDASGRRLSDTGVQFKWTAGVPIAVSSAGEVTCARDGDATVRASLASGTTNVLVRCVSVETVRLAAPFQLMVGDTPRALPVVAYVADAHPL